MKKTKPRLLLATFCAVLALAGCKTNLSKISDQQIVSLVSSNAVGTAFQPSSDSAKESDRPRQITKATQECVELLAGLNQAVYKDMPAGWMGAVKTDCRKQFQNWLDDPSRNSTKLSLEDFERKELGQRILDIAKAQKEALAEYKIKQNTAKIDAMRTELDAVTKAGTDLKATIKERRNLLILACGNLEALRNRLKSRDPTNSLLNRGIPRACTGGAPLANEWANIERFEKNVANFTLPELGKIHISSVPRLPRINLDAIDEKISRIEKVIAQYKAALSAN